VTWQKSAVIYPDAELVLTGAMRAALVAAGRSDVHVDRKVTAARPLVALTRDGGNPSELRDRPRIRFRVFAGTDQAANDLARLALALATDLPGANGITRAEILSGPYEVPDESGPMRYALVEFHIRGEEL
jgi:hypothetical protein